ncbi:LysR substrate-binding domain-containing protein [Pseudomonas sp.]|uniref:LysR substrate-binding domain-containing protein n=1 Tax=Pseudomonas sp. TaxID=306 RepID=UPI0028ABD866|nr:LysR substrate-binding domain-containing protein [Pseudomonas sp.]
MNRFKRLPLPALRIFEAAGRTCSFALAARELDLSPSAVSHAIRKLETGAELTLFTRSARTIALTAEGALLLEHVQRGLEEMSRGFAMAISETTVPLRLHVAPTFATQWLIPRLARFVREHPGIDLRISASTDYATFENDDFDLDIVYGEPRRSAHEKTPLLIEELTPLCSPELAPSIRSMQDLYAQTLIKSDGQSVQWKGWFAANDLLTPSHYGLAFDRSSMAISAAVDGLGVVLESTLLAQREIAAGKLVAPLRGLSNSVRYVGHYLVHPRRHRQHDAFTQFKRWLLEELAAGEER